MERDYDRITYINSVGKTVGKIERTENNEFVISYNDLFKELLKYKPIKLLAREGIYKRLPYSILDRAPQGNSQNERWQRKRCNYQKDYFDILYWLNLTNGKSVWDLWSFSKEPINELLLKSQVEIYRKVCNEGLL